MVIAFHIYIVVDSGDMGCTIGFEKYLWHVNMTGYDPKLVCSFNTDINKELKKDRDVNTCSNRPVICEKFTHEFKKISILNNFRTKGGDI